MIAGLAISVCVNLVLLAALVALWRPCRSRKPFDPTVAVYVQKGYLHGWLTGFLFEGRGRVPLSGRPVDAATAPLSSVREFVNMLVRQRYYVKVVQVVRPEHWRDGHAARKTGGACDA